MAGWSGGTCLGHVAVIVDETEQRSADEALRESEERFRQFAEHTPAVVYLAEPRTGSMLFISPAYDRIWGRSSASLYASPWSFLDAVQRRSTRALRQVSVDALSLGLTSLQIAARAEVRVAQAAVVSAQRALTAARRTAEQANEVLRITTVVFEVGAATNIEVIDAQRSALDAETVATQTENTWRQARLELLVALGRFPR